LSEGLEITLKTGAIDEIEQAAIKLQQSLQCRYVMATLSESGVLICDGDKNHSLHIPAHLRTIADVSGAGDTVLSIATLCLAANEDAFVIAALSNIAGGLVCEESGVVPINKTKLRKEATHFYSRNA
jgi:ADP-heptose synthase, bifunctional sugar kinase/adenylyltransferase